MKKIILTVALCLSLAVGLFACGGQSDEKKESAVSSEEAKESSNAEDKEKEKADASANTDHASRDVIRWNAGTSGNVLAFLRRRESILNLYRLRQMQML